MKITVIYINNGEKTALYYNDAESITAGKALHIMGKDDALNNGMKLTTALIQIKFKDGTTATFDADNVQIIL